MQSICAYISKKVLVLIYGHEQTTDDDLWGLKANISFSLYIETFAQCSASFAHLDSEDTMHTVRVLAFLLLL